MDPTIFDNSKNARALVGEVDLVYFSFSTGFLVGDGDVLDGGEITAAEVQEVLAGAGGLGGEELEDEAAKGNIAVLDDHPGVVAVSGLEEAVKGKVKGVKRRILLLLLLLLLLFFFGISYIAVKNFENNTNYVVNQEKALFRMTWKNP